MSDLRILYIEDNKGNRMLVRRTLEAGCDGYIQKPIDIDLLPRQVRAALQKTRACRPLP